MEINLEKVSIDDITSINKIQKIAFKESYEKYKFCPAYETTDEQLISFLERADAYKIILDDKIVGSIFICKLGDRRYELNTITIQPEYQNIGIGGKVIQKVEGFYNDALVWTLMTPETDYRNNHLYEKFGYKRIGLNVINEYLNLIIYEKKII